MGCYLPRWDVSKRDVVLLYGMGVRVRVVVLVNGMGCYSPAWGVTFRDGVLV